MELGISLYPSLSKKEIWLKKLKQAKSNNFNIVFTSIQLDTLNFEGANSLWENYEDFFKECKNLDLKVTVDVSKDSMHKFQVENFNLEKVNNYGIRALRIDGGYSYKEIAKFTNNEFNIKIEINASMTEDLDQLLEIILKEGNINNVLACHNFFPKKHTGLSIAKFNKYNEILKKYKVNIGAFISSQFSKSKLCSTSFGVPTIEKHRKYKLEYQLEDFKNSDIQYIIISEEEFDESELIKLNNFNTEYINIFIKKEGNIDQDIIEKIEKQIFSVRPDQPEAFIRFDERIGIIKPSISKHKNTSLGLITIDNSLNGRYSGEINIHLKETKIEPYLNIIGFIVQEQIDLIKNINISKKFKITFVN